MKNLGIKVVDGFVNPTILDDTIVPATINTANLGALALSILDASKDLVCLVIDLTARAIHFKPATEGDPTNILGIVEADGYVSNKVFTKTDATKRSSTWTSTDFTAFTIGAGSSAAIQNVVKPEQPSFTSGQLVGAFEDATLDALNALYAAPILLVLDQGSGEFKVLTFDSAESANAALVLWGATEGYEQIPAVTSSTTREPLG